MVYIGPDFPDEYANSKYSAKAFGAIGKAKASATQVIPELVKIATNISFFQIQKISIMSMQSLDGIDVQ